MENSTKLVTGKVRFCFCHVFEPSAMEGQPEESAKYSVNVVIPKSDTKTIDKIKKAIEAAKVVGKSKLADRNGKIPATIKIPLRDGDVERPDDPVFADAYFLNATSNRKPTIVDRNLDPIMSQDDFYSGCYGRISINMFAFNAAGNKGIAAGLQNLQKLEDGEMLSGGSTAEADFGGDNEWYDDLI